MARIFSEHKSQPSSLSSAWSVAATLAKSYQTPGLPAASLNPAASSSLTATVAATFLVTTPLLEKQIVSFFFLYIFFQIFYIFYNTIFIPAGPDCVEW
jgi:hypothetical protein